MSVDFPIGKLNVNRLFCRLISCRLSDSDPLAIIFLLYISNIANICHNKNAKEKSKLYNKNQFFIDVKMLFNII